MCGRGSRLERRRARRRPEGPAPTMMMEEKPGGWDSIVRLMERTELILHRDVCLFYLLDIGAPFGTCYVHLYVV